MSNHTQIQRIREELPATTSHLYFNAGTFGPVPSAVVQAMQERIQFEYIHGRLGAAAWDGIRAIHDSARQNVARLLNADASEIVLTNNTGIGMNIICYGLNWQEGDEIVTTNHEHYNALGPLYQIRDRYGVSIRFADLGAIGIVPVVEAISELLTARTRLIVISHVLWTTGMVLDVSKVCALGREKGIPVLIDGAQSAGAIPIDVQALGADYYAIPMQKWLCGPDGTGALYVRHEAQNAIKASFVGYMSMKHPSDADWELEEGAKRYDMGGHHPAAIAGQAAALQWLAETVGYDWLFARIKMLNEYAFSALKQLAGVHIHTPEAGMSGILSFTLEGTNTDEVVKILHDNYNILIRDIPAMKCLRISTGFYNTEEEIDTLVRALKEIQQGKA